MGLLTGLHGHEPPPEQTSLGKGQIKKDRTDVLCTLDDPATENPLHSRMICICAMATTVTLSMANVFMVIY